MLVKSMRKQGMAGMHPLSRVSASEQNINDLTDYLSDTKLVNEYLIKHSSIEQSVKLYNTACTRKAYQFQAATKNYLPELAAATLITSVMSSKTTCRQLLEITNSTLRKIAKAAGSLNQELVQDLMEYTVSSSAALSAEEIFARFKNRRPTFVEMGARAASTGSIGYIRQAGETDSLESGTSPTIKKTTKGSPRKPII